MEPGTVNGASRALAAEDTQPSNGANGSTVGGEIALAIETAPTEKAPPNAPEVPPPGSSERAAASPPPEPDSPPEDLAEPGQLLLYDDEANGFRSVRGAVLDWRELGGGLLMLVVKVATPVRVRQIPDGAIVEAPARSVIAVPVVSDLLVLAAEAASDPKRVLEVWWKPVPNMTREIGGMVMPRYETRAGWLEGATREELSK